MLWCKNQRKAFMNIFKPEVMEIRQMLEVTETCKRKFGKFKTGKWLTGAALTVAAMKIKQIRISPSKPANLSSDLMNKVILFLEGFYIIHINMGKWGYLVDCEFKCTHQFISR